MRLVYFSAFLFCVKSAAYPVIVKLDNPRNNVLLVTSADHHHEIRIEPKQSQEFLVFSPDDWRIQYATGILGAFVWMLDESFGAAIEQCIVALGPKPTLLVCSLTIDKQKGTFNSSYILKGTNIAGGAHGISKEAALPCLKGFYDLRLGLVLSNAKPALDQPLPPKYTLFCQRFGYAISGRLHLLPPLQSMESPFLKVPTPVVVDEPLTSQSIILGAWANEMDRLAPPTAAPPSKKQGPLDKLFDKLFSKKSSRLNK